MFRPQRRSRHVVAKSAGTISTNYWVYLTFEDSTFHHDAEPILELAVSLIGAILGCQR